MILARATLSAGLLLACALLGEVPCSAGTTGVLSGYVYDYDSLKPHASAMVRIALCSGFSCTAVDTRSTDSHGHYTFNSLSPGHYFISASDINAKMGSPECRFRATVDADGTTFVDLEMDRWSKAIRDCWREYQFGPKNTTSIYSFDSSGDLEH
jgi:hypothetical protein